MDTARLALCAGLILAPPATYTVWLVIYTRRRRAKRDRVRPTVAEISARIEAQENSRQRGDTSPRREDTGGQFLPPGWHWPTRDRDHP
jgi:hypothetical protein